MRCNLINITNWYCFSPESKIVIVLDEIYDNVNSYCGSNIKQLLFSDIENNVETFDYIICLINRYSKSSLLLERLKHRLSSKGVLLVVFSNKFGARYMCGAPDPYGKTPFEGITDSFCRFDKNEAVRIALNAGFKNVKVYYPFPDYYNASLIYTDEYKPGKELAEKISVDITDSGSRVMSEKEFLLSAAKAGNAEFFSNSILLECTNCKCSDLMYSCITSSRRKERAFATNIYRNTVYKVPLFEKGKESLQKMAAYTDELIANGIPALPIKFDGEKGIMERIYAPTLSDFIRDNINDKAELLSYIDKLYNYIIRSSESTDSVSEYFSEVPTNNLGLILKRAYFEMIPVNCFVRDSDLLFFDQEYVLDNCPALFILFRCIHDIYMFIPQTEKIIPQSEMINRYGLTELWNYFMKIEGNILQDGYSRSDDSGSFFIPEDFGAIKKNRNMLKMNNEIHRELYDLFSNYNDEKIILFGSGKYADYYLDKYGNSHRPDFIVDNNESKQGTEKCGIEIKSPSAIKALLYGTYRVIIAVLNYEQIVEQLEAIGVSAACYRVFNKNIDNLKNCIVFDGMSDGKYNIGYIPGAFDLFHIGHLNILRRSKERSHYLIAGVLTDEIIRGEKHKEPFIPFEERFEIVKQCKFVDRAIAVDKHNTDKFVALKELHFGCMFSGSDHELGYDSLKKQLQVLGSNLEIFPYTESTNSTMLQKLIKSRIGG